MFSRVEGKYDCIICNLPILNGDLPSNDSRWYSLFDPDFNFHKCLFLNGKKYASHILIAHADLDRNCSFGKLESLAEEYGWNVESYAETKYANHLWRAYQFKLKEVKDVTI